MLNNCWMGGKYQPPPVVSTQFVHCLSKMLRVYTVDLLVISFNNSGIYSGSFSNII